MARVVHIIKIKRIAGAERHLLLLVDGQRQHGVDAQIVMLVNPGQPMADMLAEAEARGIPIQRLVIHGRADLSLFWRLRAVLRDLRPEVVHTHLQHADLFGIPAARLAGVPVVVSSRHNDDPRRRWLWLRLLNRALWALADGGIGISQAVTRFTIAVEGVSPAKMRTIHYGVELQPPLERAPARAALRRELGLPDGALLAGIVCRLSPEKGVPYALAAFDQVADRFPAVHLVIVGDGDQRGDLEAQSQALAVGERVHFLGWRTDIPQVMAALDVLLMPSLREGFGLAMLEAMAQQVAIIGSAASAIPEVVADGETGLLVSPRDPDALAGALARLLEDAPLRQHMGLLGRDRLETRFSAERMVAETLTLYADLLARRPGSG